VRDTEESSEATRVSMGRGWGRLGVDVETTGFSEEVVVVVPVEVLMMVIGLGDGGSIGREANGEPSACVGSGRDCMSSPSVRSFV